MTPLLLKSSDAARLCGVSIRLWRTWNVLGKNPAPIRVGLTLFWKQEELLRWVEEGTKGGFVQSRENLSHDGLCWIADKALVYGHARISGDALICGQAVVRRYARVYGNAVVRDEAVLKGSVHVYENALIGLQSLLTDGATVDWQNGFAVINHCNKFFSVELAAIIKNQFSFRGETFGKTRTVLSSVVEDLS